jgi:glycosyltransferase involved in cell wall biosynthesis
MKILHITFNDYMGAGLCCRRINSALQQIGVNSKVLVLSKQSKDSSVYCFGYFNFYFRYIINKFLCLIHLRVTEMSRVLYLSKINNCAYSLPTSNIDLSTHPLVTEADIIHLHWVNNYVDLQTFFSKVKKPIVWTLHDENLFCGIAHYENSILTDEYLEKKYMRMKEDYIPQIDNLGIVFLSKYFKNKFVNNKIISNAIKTIINNSVDFTKYEPIEQSQARKKLSLDDSYVYLLFVAYDINEKRKGLDKLIEAVELLGKSNVRILAIGKNKHFTGHKSVISYGLVNDIETYSCIVSACDYFIMPSSQEAFAQTPIEAMACGKPVVVFPVSGTDELINESIGVRCDGFSVEALKAGLLKAMSTNYVASDIRNYVISYYSPEVIARMYLAFYNEMINKKL